MKKTFSNIRTLAALLMAGAAFAACSSNDDNIIEQQPANHGEQVYTLTINATKDGGSQTRALTLDGANLVASWHTNDIISVIKTSPSYSSLGLLSPTNISADGKSATLSGSVSGAVSEGDVLILSYQWHDISGFAGQNGKLNGNALSAEAYDMAEATVTVASVNGTNITTTADASFETKTAMIKFTLQDNAASPNKLNATSLTISVDGIGELLTFNSIDADASTANGGDGILYFALPSAAIVANEKITTTSALADATVTFTATVGSNTYTATKMGYPFAAGSYYTSTLTMVQQ